MAACASSSPSPSPSPVETIPAETLAPSEPASPTPAPGGPQAKTYDWSQYPGLLFYMVQTEPSRGQMQQIDDAYFKLWGGPHVTLGGKATHTNSQVNEIVAGLQKLDTSAWTIGTDQVKVKNSSNGKLIEAHFSSSLADEAKQVLDEYKWQNVKSGWHVTLGYTAKGDPSDPLSKTDQDQMVEILKASDWTFVVNLGDSANTWVAVADIDTGS